VSIRRDIENQVRSIVKEYGVTFKRAIGATFRKQVTELLGEKHRLRTIIDPLLSIHAHVCEQQRKFDDEVRRLAKSCSAESSWMSKLLAPSAKPR
jgi:transposase